MQLSQLPRRTAAVVQSVEAQGAADMVARRLRELGFVAGERVEVLAVGPFSAEPLLVQVGFTRFALRLAEAARIRVAVGEPADAVVVTATEDPEAVAPDAALAARVASGVDA